jgi:phospholipase C
MLGTRPRIVAGAAVVALLAVGCTAVAAGEGTGTVDMTGIHKIKHVIVIMQENRSFDSYFGTYPGADGIPMRNGRPTVCVPDPALHHCVRPFHDRSYVNAGGPHGVSDATRDIDGGRMDGFVPSVLIARRAFCRVTGPNDPRCAGQSSHDLVPDAMGYHTAREIPNYWTYAKNFVLQDHMFEPVKSWSLPSHLWMVSAWSARCANTRDPMTCRTDINAGRGDRLPPGGYPWTDLTWLLHEDGVSWRYYIGLGAQPDCTNDRMFCYGGHQSAGTPSIWNPLPQFQDVQQDGQLSNVQPVGDFYRAARSGNLPNVAWVVPNQRDSEHPPASIRTGQAYVTGLINAVMRSPEWSSTAIFLAWDDWGGFYDHVVPPVVSDAGYGIRVPGLLISPYARTGYVDHQTLSFDAYLKFIEDDFLGGQRLDPSTDGRPDSRPSVAESAPALGNLISEFDFHQHPRPPVLLRRFPPRPPVRHLRGPVLPPRPRRAARAPVRHLRRRSSRSPAARTTTHQVRTKRRRRRTG